jgi:hypothetical protein
MRAVLFLLLGASLVLGACGNRVSVGFVETPGRQGEASSDGGSPPLLMSDASPLDASRREAGIPSAGCDNKDCGDYCTPCEDPSQPCAPAKVFHVCSAHGQCVPEQPGCVVIQELDGAPGAQPFVPCAGLSCGAPCPTCNPSRGACSGQADGFCQVDGTCAALAAECD